MPIIHMGHSATPGVILPGAVTHFCWENDEPRCAHESTRRMGKWRDGAPHPEEMYLYETHHGLCIRDREMNGYDDSDFYMLIWDEELQQPFEVCFASTRGWSYPCYGSSPDATPEVMAAYEAWRQREMARINRHRERIALLAIVRAVEAPHVGAHVIVARGRKVKKGTTGRVLSISTRRGFTNELESWALLDTGRGFTPVLACHLNIIAAAPKALQDAFDVAC